MTRSPSVVPVWHVKRGLVAAAIAVFFLEAVAAGSSRNCMPAFDLNILAGQVLLFTIFGAPAIVIVGITAFITASVPSFVSARSRLSVAGGMVATAAVILATPLQSFWALPFAGVLVGLVVRVTGRYWRWWFPAAIALSLGVASAIFAFGHYGQDNCYP